MRFEYLKLKKINMYKVKIKNPSLIKKESENPSINEVTYLVKSGVNYLGEVISELPAGVINKTKTGVGATTLEMKTPRNSIVVEPLKITASSKSLKSTKYLYVGSSTETKKKVTDQEILDYLKNPTIVFKKIICVTDSLERVVSLLDPKELETYFLLLDESDSLQLDSGFRKNMFKAIRIFKEFNPENRALISATPMKMHDPYFETVPKTVFNFEEKMHYSIHIIDSENFAGSTIDEIIKKFKASTDEKIVIAYNSVIGIKYLADNLVANGIPKSEITVLCGKQSFSKVKGYKKIFKDENLSTRITFKTAAYFTGFDILEKYHLILILDNHDFKNSPSVNRILQIAGRARNGLNSFVIIRNFDEEFSYPEFDLKNLFERAENQIAGLKCLSSKKVTFGVKAKEKAIESFLSTAAEETLSYNLVEINQNCGSLEFNVAFPSIDAIIDIQKTRKEIYTHRNDLKLHFMRLRFGVTYEKKNSATKVNQIKSQREIRKIEKILIQDALDLIKSNPTKVKDALLESSNNLEEKIFNIFLKYRDEIDRNQLIELLEECTKCKCINAELHKLEMVLSNELIKRSSSALRDVITASLPINRRIYNDEICAFTEELLEKASLDILNPKSEKSCVKLLETLVQIEKIPFNKTRIAKGSRPFYKVKSHDPLGMPIKRAKISALDFL